MDIQTACWGKATNTLAMISCKQKQQKANKKTEHQYNLTKIPNKKDSSSV